jgi:tRNA(fMet)-specific endonuclease VapC
LIYALDTNIVIAALNQIGPVVDRIAATAPGDILIPDLVIAELLFGAHTSGRVRENLSKVNRLVAAFPTAPFDTMAARRFAEIKAQLRRCGRVKQDFDLAIASIALVKGAMLVTHDGGLLEGDVPDLPVEDWLA